MGDYLIWMMRYSDALRKLLEGTKNVNNMSLTELLEVLEKPENINGHTELAKFLEEINNSKLPVEDQAIRLKENYSKYFIAA